VELILAEESILAEEVILANPVGGVNFNRTTEGETTGKFVLKRVPRGSRLTPERLSKMKIGTDFLSNAEKALFIDILFKYEGAIAFDES
jgi:hypothetical protein